MELEYLIQNRIYSVQSSLNHNQKFQRKSKKSKAKTIFEWVKKWE